MFIQAMGSNTGFRNRRLTHQRHRRHTTTVSSLKQTNKKHLSFVSQPKPSNGTAGAAWLSINWRQQQTAALPSPAALPAAAVIQQRRWNLPLRPQRQITLPPQRRSHAAPHHPLLAVARPPMCHCSLLTQQSHRQALPHRMQQTPPTPHYSALPALLAPPAPRQQQRC